MANPNNFGVLTGRVSQDKVVFQNSDGSKTVLVTIAVDDNFRSGADRKTKTQFISARAFIPASVDGLGSWDRVGKGDLISANIRLAAAPYEKNGETVYPDVQVEFDGYPQFLESKAVTEARAAKKAVASAPAEPTEETADEKIARLQAELAAAQGVDVDSTSPFATV